MKSSTSRVQIEREAIRWLQKRETEQWTPADDAELDRWLQASAGHSVSYIRLRSVWRRVEQLKHNAEGLPAGQVRRRGTHTPAPCLRPALPQNEPALAATVLLSMALGILAYRHRRLRLYYPIGGMTVVALGDRSTIMLNTHTRIRVWSSTTTRRVEIEYGEALFDIAPDSRRSLTVYAANQRVVVLGTKFSVWSKPDLLHVAVLSDRYASSPRDQSPPAIPRPTVARHLNVATLGRGEVADVRNGDITLRQESVEDIERSLAWQTGEIRLDGAPLSEAVAAFNRYNTRQIVFGDPSLRQVRIGGSFHWDNVDGFLGLLDDMGIHSQVQNGQVVLTSKH